MRLICSIVFPLSVPARLHRKFWEEESGKKGDRFDLEAVVGARGSDHDMLLKRAVVIYDTLFGNSNKGVGFYLGERWYLPMCYLSLSCRPVSSKPSRVTASPHLHRPPSVGKSEAGKMPAPRLMVRLLSSFEVGRLACFAIGSNRQQQQRQEGQGCGQGQT